MTEPRVWYVLQHNPGPALPAGASVMDQPGIAEHYAFLQRRLAAGELVAAGPLGDGIGEGMTVLDVASEDEAQRLAREDDASVRDGLLAVVVRPWRVVLTRTDAPGH